MHRLCCALLLLLSCGAFLSGIKRDDLIQDIVKYISIYAYNSILQIEKTLLKADVECVSTSHECILICTGSILDR